MGIDFVSILALTPGAERVKPNRKIGGKSLNSFRKETMNITWHYKPGERYGPLCLNLFLHMFIAQMSMRYIITKPLLQNLQNFRNFFVLLQFS